MSILKVFKKKKKAITSVEPSLAKIDKIPESKADMVRGVENRLRSPWQSEKANALREKNQYVFVTDRESNKSEVKKEIERRYGVHVRKVNIVNQRGKIKRFGAKTGRLPQLKKAIVSIKEGEKIEIT